MQGLAYVHHSSFLAPISKSKITHTTPKNVSKLHKTHISNSYPDISVLLRRKTNRYLKNRNVWTRRLIFPTRKYVHENVFPGFKKSVWIIRTKQSLQSVDIWYRTICENLVYIIIYSGSDKIYIFRCWCRYFAYFSIFDEATLVHKVKSDQTNTLRGGLYSYNISVWEYFGCRRLYVGAVRDRLWKPLIFRVFFNIRRSHTCTQSQIQPNQHLERMSLFT